MTTDTVDTSATADGYRVLHLMPDLARGGGQAVVLELAAHADRTRFEIYVARLQPPDDMGPAFEDVGVKPIRLIHGGDGVVAAAFELSRHLRLHDIDLVHVHSDADRKVGHLAALLSGRPVVGHLHSPWPHLQPMHAEDAGALARRWSRAKARLRRQLESRVVRHYLAAGDEVAAFHVGRLDAPIAIVRNGIDTVRFAPPSEEERLQARAQLGLGADELVFVCVGRLAAGKGQDELIMVMPELPSGVLLLAGDGEERSELEELARRCGVEDRVVFLGDRDDVATVLAAADMFLLASVSEGLPLSVLEAMACRLPVVAYDLPGLHSLIASGRDGLLVPLRDRSSLAAAVRDLAENGDKRAAMGRAGRTVVVDRFDSEMMARNAETTYDLVLGNDPLNVRRANGRRLAIR